VPLILDGEVVARDEDGRQDFRAVMAGRGNLHYAVFDVVWLKGNDLRECPRSPRKRILSWRTIRNAAYTKQESPRSLPPPSR
jgi:bifunctional non-homologous end joining protein LigD